MNRQSKHRRRSNNRARAGHRAAARCAPRALRTRRAMTLLEVILSIAILAGTLAILGEAIRAGARAGRSTSKLSAAQLLCESMMTEITSGTTTPESMQGEQIDDNGDSWEYIVTVEQGGQEGMLAVMVTVQEPASAELAAPVSFSLVRWMVDPQLEAELEAAAEEAEAAAEATQEEDSAAAESSGGGTDTPASSGGAGASGGAPSGGTGR